MKNNYSNLRNTYKNTNLNVLVGDAEEFAVVQTEKGGNNKTAILFRTQDFPSGGGQPSASTAQCADWDMEYSRPYQFDNGVNSQSTYAYCTNVAVSDGAGKTHVEPMILCRNENSFIGTISGDTECCPLTTGQSSDTSDLSLMFYDKTRDEGKKIYCKPPTNNYGWWPVPSPLDANGVGHDCKTNSQNCTKSGIGVCSYDNTRVCSHEDQKAFNCFAEQPVCEKFNRCDEEGGWTWNTAHTNCNAFKCTTDGGLPGDLSKNNDKHYTYKPPPLPLGPGQTLAGSCYRKSPSPLDHPSQYAICAKEVFGGCNDDSSDYGNQVKKDWLAQGWTYTGCSGDYCYCDLTNESNVAGSGNISYHNPYNYTVHIPPYGAPVDHIGWTNNTSGPPSLNLSPGFYPTIPS